MCLSFYEVQKVATDEENAVLFDENSQNLKLYRYQWGSPEYKEWYRVYDNVVNQYDNRKAAQRREALRLLQEKELQEKERELWKAAVSLGLDLAPNTCRLQFERNQQGLSVISR